MDTAHTWAWIEEIVTSKNGYVGSVVGLWRRTWRVRPEGSSFLYIVEYSDEADKYYIRRNGTPYTKAESTIKTPFDTLAGAKVAAEILYYTGELT